MQSTLRPRLAAALLLSPLAALVAQPALANHREAVIVESPVAPAVVVPERGYDGWRYGWRRDERPPQIVDLTPQPGERAEDRRRTLVSARFFDHRSGVDPQSVQLRIDGRDVTADARIFADQVRYREQLWPGRHVAEVTVRDHAGNTARRAWQFDVPQRDPEGYGDGNGGGYRGYGSGYGYGYGYGNGGWSRY